jgi:transposase
MDLPPKRQNTAARIWIAAGVTDMRRSFHGLAAQVQTALEQQPYFGHFFVFRGRRGDMVKVLCLGRIAARSTQHAAGTALFAGQ